MQYGVLLFAVANKSKLDSSENTINRLTKICYFGKRFQTFKQFRNKKETILYREGKVTCNQSSNMKF